MKSLILFLMVLSVCALASGQTSEKPASASAETQKNTLEIVKLFKQKKFDEALPLAKKVISLMETELGKQNLLLASAWRNLAYIQYNLAQKKEASESFEKAFSIYEKNQPLSTKDGILFAEISEAVGTFSAIDGNLYNAEKKFLRAIELREKINGKNSAELSNALSKLADIYQLESNYEKAEPLLERALDVKTNKDNKLADETAKENYDNLRCLLTKLHRAEEIEQLQKRFYPAQSGTAENIGNSAPKSINGGVINGKALILPKPIYPAEAREKRASGTVSVQVLIDETGKVISACAVSGARELHRGSESSALQAKFSPTTLEGKPVKVSGVITYNYVP